MPSDATITGGQPVAAAVPSPRGPVRGGQGWGHGGSTRNGGAVRGRNDRIGELGGDPAPFIRVATSVTCPRANRVRARRDDRAVHDERELRRAAADIDVKNR